MKRNLPARRAVGAHDVDNYDPKKGVATIAVAEAAERMYRRARDVGQLSDAVEVKLSEQRKFVLWWDAQGRKGGNPTVTGLQRLESLGLDRVTVHRWRVRLKDETKFTKAVAAAQERCRRICEAERGGTEQKGATGTGDNEWFTPQEHIELARTVLGAIDLDPATSAVAQKHIRAQRHFTVREDGLAQEWSGRVWLNPPYAQPAIGQFVSKLVAEYRASRTTAAILLTHNYTDTTWFHEAAGAASAICFTRGRVRFWAADGTIAAPTQGQAFFYFGRDPSDFTRQFRGIGFVVTPA